MKQNKSDLVIWSQMDVVTNSLKTSDYESDRVAANDRMKHDTDEYKKFSGMWITNG